VKVNQSRGTGVLNEPHSLIGSTNGKTKYDKILYFSLILSAHGPVFFRLGRVGFSLGEFEMWGRVSRGGGVVWVEMVFGG
jgi:hypothetical protein